MTETTPRSGPADRSLLDPWRALLAVTAIVVAVVDLVFLALISEIVPPLVIAAALSVVGVVLLRRRPRVGIGVLGVTTALMLLGTLPFAVDHLSHPDSGIDWAHAVIGVAGRIVVLAAAIGAWRSASDGAARRLGVLSVGALGAVAAIALVATTVTTGEDRQPGDILLSITATEFPDRVEVRSGDVLFVDNEHMFRHTFTVEETDIDVQLPAFGSVRIPIDLTPGTYRLICDVPGHESMTGELVVTST